LAAGYYLAKWGIKTLILEKRLSIGGGIWGGAAGVGFTVGFGAIIAFLEFESNSAAGENPYHGKGVSQIAPPFAVSYFHFSDRKKWKAGFGT
jgi:phytoene dehydrogenase-like protein